MAVKFRHQSQSGDILKAVRSIALKSYSPGRIKTKETGFLRFLRFVTNILRKTRFLAQWVSPKVNSNDSGRVRQLRDSESPQKVEF